MWELLNGILGSIALLNKEYFIKNDFYRFRESFHFTKTPKNYEQLIKKYYTTKEPEKIITSIHELFNNFKTLLHKNEVHTDTYSTRENIKV